MATPDPERWRPANNGSGPRMWFVCRGYRQLAYVFDTRGLLVRYSSYKSAKRRADKENAKDGRTED